MRFFFFFFFSSRRRHTRCSRDWSSDVCSSDLSQIAAERSPHEFIVFCGVHFMAETADILSKARQTVILPDLAAGCSMADMAQIEQVDQAWEQLGRILPVEEAVTPVVYVNSAADLKEIGRAHV